MLWIPAFAGMTRKLAALLEEHGQDKQAEG